MPIYVLECKEGMYYVGRSNSVKKRIESHFKGMGSEWTKLYPPIRIVETVPTYDNLDEDKYVLKYMMKYGIDRVRGGSYSKTVLDEGTRIAIQRQIDNASDACYICHKIGHFARCCQDSVPSEISESSDDTEGQDYVYLRLEDTTEGCMKQEKSSIFRSIITWFCEKKLAITDSETCTRCGRSSHTKERCYAKTYINGCKIE